MYNILYYTYYIINIVPESIKLVPFSVSEWSECLLGGLVEVDDCVAADETGGVGALPRIVARVVDYLLAAQRGRLGRRVQWKRVQWKRVQWKRVQWKRVV